PQDADNRKARASETPKKRTSTGVRDPGYRIRGHRPRLQRKPPMANFLDQLSELDVPPPPERFDDELHNRVNQSLLSLQVAEFYLRAMPAALFELGRAFVGFVIFSLTGRFEDERPRRKPAALDEPENPGNSGNAAL